MSLDRELNIGGQSIHFLFIVDPHTGIPAWIAEYDELMLNIIGTGLYDFINKNIVVCTKYNISNKKNFGATMSIASFKSCHASGEVARFRDTVMYLLNTMKAANNGRIPNKMYVAFNSSNPNSPHVVHAMIEGEANSVVFGSNIDNNAPAPELIILKN